MYLNATLFNSKVTRRMFLLFVLSALVPVCVLAYMTYQQISVLIDKQSTQFLHQSSKAIGLRLFEKLSELTELTDRHLSSKPFSIEKFRENIIKDRQMQKLFLSAGLHENKQTTSLFGESQYFPPISISDHNRLNNGGYILVSRTNQAGDKDFYLVKKIHSTGYLTTHINPSYLWDISHFLPSDAEVCVLDHMYTVLFCTDDLQLASQLTPALLSASQTHSSFEWIFKDTTYTAYVRPLFLKGAFQSPDWSIVLSIPKARAFKPLSRFQNLFPPLIILSILLVGLLSSHQIRKSLVPLEKLKEGTQAITEGKFSTRVDINSDDEFEELATSFNTMSKKLETQFKSLQIMAEIDRIMLSSLDSNYIVETVVDRIKDITEADKSVIYKVRQHQSAEDVENKNSILCTTATLKQTDLQLINNRPRYLFFNNMKDLPDFLQDLSIEGAKSLVLLPIYIKDVLVATVAVAYNRPVNFDHYDFQHARELADRIAVAMTSADWEDKVYRQANFDALTDLPNRKLLTDRLNQAMQRAKRDRTRVAVLLVDLDRFKAINDSLGQSKGDIILKEMGMRFRQVIRETDTLARFGGDEFVIIMSDIPYTRDISSMVNPLAEALLNAALLPLDIQGHELNVTASLGVALFPNDTHNVGDLLKFAESAMYHAKSLDKGAYMYYSKDIDATTLSQLVLESDLRNAFQKDELELFFQPQLELSSNKIVCAEALIRWNHSDLGLLSPDKFLPLASNTGLTVTLGNWIIEKAVAQLRNWLEEDVEVPRIAVNISAQQFNTGNLVQKVRQTVQNYSVDVNLLELEITEDTLMSDLENTFNVLQNLKQLGIKLAIDDFGTGYSSLSYLTKFPIDYLKIDQSFVRELPDDRNVASIVSATIAMAHSMNLKVIAEGVENEKQLEFLKSRNCDIVQGFLFYKPVPADKMLELLARSKRVANS